VGIGRTIHEAVVSLKRRGREDLTPGLLEDLMQVNNGEEEALKIIDEYDSKTERRRKKRV
jgi:hypothetical protein